MKRIHSADVHRAIAEHAYFISEKQGFAHGREVENWMAAKREVFGNLLKQRSEKLPTNGGPSTPKSPAPARNAERGH